MVPEEWPIAASSADQPVEPARRAGRRRLATVRQDFFLDPALRLTEQERALMTAMLHGLVSDIADDLRTSVRSPAANDDVAPDLVERLSACGLLDIPDLVDLLLQSAEQEQVAGAVKSRSPRRGAPFLQRLVSDENADVSAAAMALIVARGRRTDRFGQPRIEFDDLPASAVAQVVMAVAAGLGSAAPAEEQARFASAAEQMMTRHRARDSLSATAYALVQALDEAAQLGDECLFSMAEDGDWLTLAHAFARRAGVPFAIAVEALHGGNPDRLTLLFRLADLSRDCAARMLAGFGDLFGVEDPVTALGRFEATDEGATRVAGERARLPRLYSLAVDMLGSGDGQRTR